MQKDDQDGQRIPKKTQAILQRSIRALRRIALATPRIVVLLLIQTLDLGVYARPFFILRLCHVNLPDGSSSCRLRMLFVDIVKENQSFYVSIPGLSFMDVHVYVL